METTSRLVRRVESEQDDILGTMQLVAGDELLEARLWGQLVDLLVEGLFLQLRQQAESGELGEDDYLVELAALATSCRRAGLLPISNN